MPALEEREQALTHHMGGVVDAGANGSLRWRRYAEGQTLVEGSRGAFVLEGLIAAHWWHLGGPYCALGAPVTDELDVGDGRGRYNDFEQGSIYWSDPTGAHEVHGHIGHHWVQAGRTRRDGPGYPRGDGLGYPITDELRAGPYCYQYFQFGSLVWTPHGGVRRGCPPTRLFGFADTHAHPAAHLGFGGKIFHGAVEGHPSQALAHCRTSHGIGGTGILSSPTAGGTAAAALTAWIAGATGLAAGAIGDIVTQVGLNGGGFGHLEGGYPQFDGWPTFGAVGIPVHQQMFLPWVERSYRHGQRLLVALANHSRDLAFLVRGDGPDEDMAAGLEQIAYVKELAGRHSDWMTIVTTPERAREVIAEDRLAVILGLELDTMGGITEPHGARIDPVRLQRLADQLENLDVRYVFPVHLNDNAFGATAVYHDAFLASSAAALRPVEVEPSAQVTWSPAVDTSGAPAGQGVVNRKGLTEAGAHLLRLLMDKKMLIDIDHMSWRCTEDALRVAEEIGYPLVSGHATFAELAPWADPHDGPNESRKQAETLRRLAALGAFVGVQTIATRTEQHPGSGDEAWLPHGGDAAGSSTSFARAYRYARSIMGDQLAIGTDFNGLAATCGPRFGPLGAHHAPHDQRPGQVEGQQRGVNYAGELQDLRPSRFTPAGTHWDERDALVLRAVLMDRSGAPTPAWGDPAYAELRTGGGFAHLPSLIEGLRATTRPSGGQQRAAYVARHHEDPALVAPADRDVHRRLVRILQMVERMDGPNPPLDRCRTDGHDWDLNLDGLAHYGLLPDFLADLGNTGMNWDGELLPLLTSAESVVSTWERCTDPGRRGPAEARPSDPRTLERRDPPAPYRKPSATGVTVKPPRLPG